MDLFKLTIHKEKLENISSVYQTIKPTLEKCWEQGVNVHPDLGFNAKTTYDVNNQLHLLPELKTLVDQIYVCVNQYWKELHLYEGLTPVITEMWSNKNQKGNSIHPHNHAPNLLNGVIYLNAEKEDANIVFENPLALLVSMQPLSFSGKEDIAFGIEKEVEVTTGDIIIFPGWLKHYTRIQTHSDERVVLAFNVGCTGNYPISSYVNN